MRRRATSLLLRYLLALNSALWLLQAVYCLAAQCDASVGVVRQAGCVYLTLLTAHLAVFAYNCGTRDKSGWCYDAEVIASVLINLTLMLLMFRLRGLAPENVVMVTMSLLLYLRRGCCCIAQKPETAGEVS